MPIFQSITNITPPIMGSPRIQVFLIFFCLLLAEEVIGQEGGNQEFSPYVFKAVNIPYKNRNYAGDFFNQDAALVQSPLLAPVAKGPKYADPIKLPTIAPYIVPLNDLSQVAINDENTWNTEKRLDSKVWWP